MDSIEIRPEKAEKVDRYLNRGTTILAVILLIVSAYQYLNDLSLQYHVVLIAFIALFFGISDVRNPKPRFGYLLIDDEGIKWRGKVEPAELEWNKIESLTYRKSKVAYKFRNGMKGSLSIPWLIRWQTDEIQNTLRTYCAEKDIEFLSQL